MNKLTVCIILLAFYSGSVKACDVCGASSGNQNLGLLPQMYRHFAGIQYQYNNFESRHVPLSDKQPVWYGDEHYNTVQVWGRFCPAKRWQIFAFVPYRRNISSTKDGGYNVISGMGDATIVVNYTLVQSADSSEKLFKHRLQAGVGIKAPTGSYRGVSELERAGLPNLQPGTGSWDIPVNANYTLRYKNAGINADASFSMTTPNKDRYKYGNRLNTQLTAFYWWQMGKVSLLPMAGSRIEYALHDYDNYDRKWLNEQTGGYILSATAGVQAYYSKIGVQLQYSRPMSQHFGGGNITARQRIDAGIMFLF